MSAELPPKWHGDDYARRHVADIRDRMPFHVIDAINDEVTWLLDEVDWLLTEKGAS